MAEQYFRLDKSGLQTGYSLETVTGNPETLTSASFVGDYEASLISPKYETVEIKVGGQVGTSKLVTTKKFGELNSFKVPVANSNCDAVFRAGGAFVVGGNYQFGGSYVGMSSPNKGRISTSGLTFVQYDGKEKYTLFGAKASTLKVGQKVGEVVYLDASFQGSISDPVSSDIQYFQKPTSNNTYNTNGILSIAGTNFDYKEIEIDLKPTLKMIESASTSAGYLQAEIVDQDPTITVTIYPSDPSVKNLWALIASNTPVPFSWSFGSGAGNVVTFTATVGFSSQESPYDAGVQVRKIVMKPVYNSANSYRLNINVA